MINKLFYLFFLGIISCNIFTKNNYLKKYVNESNLYNKNEIEILKKDTINENLFFTIFKIYHENIKLDSNYLIKIIRDNKVLFFNNYKEDIRVNLEIKELEYDKLLYFIVYDKKTSLKYVFCCDSGKYLNKKINICKLLNSNELSCDFELN